MFEQLLSILASAVVCVLCLLRLNELNALRLEEIRRQRVSLTVWRVLEGLGLAIVAGGCVGAVGEWFLDGVSLDSETIVLVGAAIFGVGVSHTLHSLAWRVGERPDDSAPGVRVGGFLTEEHEFEDLLELRFRRPR
jgi:hypothetical protein